jgi:very-short-patch-repair endonuclease
MFHYERHLRAYSRSLRKDMTDAEMKLWSRIRGKQLRGVQFYRQKPLGGFIVDFFCPKAKLIIELDGGQHYSAAGLAKDETRDGFFKKAGLKVLRFSDREVFERLEAVLEKIDAYVSSQISPSPSLQKRGRKDEEEGEQ